jgi:hypothetical protein
MDATCRSTGHRTAHGYVNEPHRATVFPCLAAEAHTLARDLIDTDVLLSMRAETG